MQNWKRAATAIVLAAAVNVSAAATDTPDSAKSAARSGASGKSEPPPAAAQKGGAEQPGTPKIDQAKAEAARNKPLQRCDQLKDKAQVECLDKARERIVEARQKRESKSGKAGSDLKGDVPTVAEKKTK